MYPYPLANIIASTDPIGTNLSGSSPVMPVSEPEKPEYEGSDFRGGAFNQALGLSVNYLPPKEGESDLFDMKGNNTSLTLQASMVVLAISNINLKIDLD